MAFDPKKIKRIGEIPERRLKPIKNIINKFIKNPENIHGKDENLRLETTKLFYSLALYFNLYFQKDKIKEMFDNDKICDYLFEKLLSYREFFKDLILPIEDVAKLIKNKEKVTKYDHILTLLFYIGTDICDFLEIVTDTKDYIYKFQKEEMNKNKNNKFYDNKINIENYVVPKMEDNLDDIFTKLENLKMYTSMINEDMILIKYYPLIIEKYSEFYDHVNLDKLITLKSIVESIKKIDQTFESKCNLEEKIHKTGLNLIKMGKIKNIEILNLIQTGIYYPNNSSNNKFSFPLEYLDGIDISLIDDKKNDFFKKWNAINFYSMYGNELGNYLKKVSSLIKEIKDFGYLLKFHKSPEEEYKKEVIKSLKTRFIEIIPTYNEKECPNFINDVVELIYRIDYYKSEIKKFLVEIIEKKFNVKMSMIFILI